jgi:hypothetical protein
MKLEHILETNITDPGAAKIKDRECLCRLKEITWVQRKKIKIIEKQGLGLEQVEGQKKVGEKSKLN